MSTLSLNVLEHKTDGAKINNLAALQMKLLKRYVISEMNVSRIGVTRAPLEYSSGELAGTFSR